MQFLQVHVKCRRKLKKQLKNNLNKGNKKLNAYAKYSSISIQMALIITVGAFGGKKLDAFLNLDFPIFTLGLSILAVIVAVYLAIKDIIKYNS